MTDFGQPLRNVSKSAVLSVSGWDTDPTDLANAIDGDLSNPTGIGSTTMGTWGYAGYLNIEMPAAGRRFYGFKFDVVDPSGFPSVSFQVYSVDAYSVVATIYGPGTSALGDPGGSVVVFAAAKKTRLGFFAGDAGLFEAQIYDISIYEL